MARYSKQREPPSPIPLATVTQQAGTWAVTAAPTGTEEAEIRFRDEGAVPAGPTATTSTTFTATANTEDTTSAATSFAFTTPTQQLGWDYNKAVVQQ